MEEQQRSAEIQLFGDFVMRYNGKTADDCEGRSLKMWSVLTYLILHRNRKIPQEELQKAIWQGEGGKNPATALKALIFRVRKELSALFGEDTPVVLSQRGIYYWAPRIHCRLDTDLFEETLAAAQDPDLNEGAKAAYYAKALALYKGDFLSRLHDQPWTTDVRQKYRELYLNAAKDYARLLLKSQDYAEAETVCLAAIEIEKLDERLYVHLLRSLLAQEKHVIAMNHYEAAVEGFSRHLGLQPSTELREIYREIVKGQKQADRDLGCIIKDIDDRGPTTGAFLCDLPFFKDAYRLTARQACRDNSCVHIVLLTLSGVEGDPLSLDTLEGAMTQLSEVLVAHLRRGDVVTQYSGTQYLILLPHTEFQESLDIVHRLLELFSVTRYAKEVSISLSIQKMDLDAYV